MRRVFTVGFYISNTRLNNRNNNTAQIGCNLTATINTTYIPPATLKSIRDPLFRALSLCVFTFFFFYISTLLTVANPENLTLIEYLNKCLVNLRAEYIQDQLLNIEIWASAAAISLVSLSRATWAKMEGEAVNEILEESTKKRAVLSTLDLLSTTSGVVALVSTTSLLSKIIPITSKHPPEATNHLTATWVITATLWVAFYISCRLSLLVDGIKIAHAADYARATEVLDTAASLPSGKEVYNEILGAQNPSPALKTPWTLVISSIIALTIDGVYFYFRNHNWMLFLLLSEFPAAVAIADFLIAPAIVTLHSNAKMRQFFSFLSKVLSCTLFLISSATCILLIFYNTKPINEIRIISVIFLLISLALTIAAFSLSREFWVSKCETIWDLYWLKRELRKVIEAQIKKRSELEHLPESIRTDITSILLKNVPTAETPDSTESGTQNPCEITVHK